MECDDSMDTSGGTTDHHDNSHQPFDWPHPLPPFPEPFQAENDRDGFQWKADKLAAEAMASDLSKWIVFDPSESGVEELDKFLEINAPSVIKRSDGIGWICVLGPHYLEERPWESESEDRVGLQEAWESMQKSGRPINFDTVLDLAKAYKCLSGKWLFHMETGFKVDHAWAKVARGIVSGQFGMSAKVSPSENEGGTWKRHVICVYNKDFTNQEAVFHLEDGLRKAGIKCSMTYKPDAFTYMGIYRNNKWQLQPAIHASDYNLNLQRSKFTAVYDSHNER